MDKRILKSIASMASVAVIGIGTSYALFTASPVTIQASSATTGSADLRICNADGDNNWKTSVNPGLILDGLAPGDSDIELTNGATGIFIGNDDGNLTDNVNSGSNCGSYNGPAGSSDVELTVIPKLDNVSCPDSNLANDLELKFQFGNNTPTDYQTLTDWQSNATPLPLDPSLNIDEARKIRVFAQLSPEASEQGVNCAFDMVFDGEQTPSTPEVSEIVN